MTFADPSSLIAESIQQQVLHPGSRALFRYWETLRAERGCPDREQINLREIKDILPSLFILDRDTAADSFRYRLSGTMIDRLGGMNMTGCDILVGWDMFERDVILRALRVAHEKLQPAIVRMRLFTDLNEIVGAEMIALPVKKRSGDDIELVGGLFPFTDLTRIAFEKISHRQLVTTRTIWTEHVSASGDLAPVPKPPKSSTPLRVIQGGRTV